MSSRFSKRPNFSRGMDMEWLVGWLLTAGIGLSAVFLIAAVMWRWAATGGPDLRYDIAGENLFEFWKNDIRQVTAGAFRPRLLANIGIAILLVTPYLRVAASMLYFAFAERNWKYTAFTGLVLAMLTYSLFLR